jgi:hypothetical protein
MQIPAKSYLQLWFTLFIDSEAAGEREDVLELMGAMDLFVLPLKVLDQGRNRRERVKCQFSMQAMIKGYISTYDQVLSKTAGTSHVGCGSSNNRPL